MKAKYGTPTLWFCTHCKITEPDVEGKTMKKRCKCGWYMQYRLLMQGDSEGAKIG